MIQFDYPGLGLPSPIWYEVVNLLYRITDMTCTDSLGGSCMLSNTCSSYESLWDYSFKGRFGDNEKYFIVPLAAFATDTDSGQCQLWISYLETGY